jgi:hypothetical protein
VIKLIESDFHTDEFEHVLKQLDFGEAARNAIMFGNGVYTLEALMFARYNLSYCNLKDVDRYDQLRLYFVTEWVNEFGSKNMIPRFTASGFRSYFVDKLDHLIDGTTCISPSHLERDESPCHSYFVIISALTSDDHGFAKRKASDHDGFAKRDDGDVDI